MSNSLRANAINLASEGHHAEAAAQYAQLGFARLFEANYEVSAAIEGTTFFLYTVSYDCIADIKQRARGTINFVRPWFQELYKTTTDECLKGLVKEWLGDCHFYIGDDDCLAYYGEACSHYEQNELDDWKLWGAVPPYDNCYGAMEDFLETKGIDFRPYSLAFIERIDTKTELYHELYTQE